MIQEISLTLFFAPNPKGPKSVLFSQLFWMTHKNRRLFAIQTVEGTTQITVVCRIYAFMTQGNLWYASMHIHVETIEAHGEGHRKDKVLV